MVARKWHVAASAAADTSDPAEGRASSLCTSAGTLVAAPARIGSQQPYGRGSWDLSPPGLPGRAT
eukprot:11182302-Lingulodinium_polyedra.AAC.1